MAIDAINVVLLVTLAASACMAVFMKDLVRSALSLAVMSALLAVLLYRLNSPYAAVFELSVVAGLITVLFVSTIAMTGETDSGEDAGLSIHIFILSLIAFGLLDILVTQRLFASAPTGAGNVYASFGLTLWGVRALDLLGQMAVILGGVFGVLALLRDRTTDEEKR
jgi:NADH-quinone oxidoreductase subunit J